MNPSLLKLTKARTALILQQPFFGTVALRVKFLEDPTAPTAWTDGIHMGYNPAYIDGLTMDETKGLIAHEVMHITNLHHLRQGPRKLKKWNYAGDYAINGLLQRAGFVLPKGGLANPAYDAMSAEHVYNLIPDPPEDGGQGGAGNQPGQGQPDPAGEVRPYPGPDPALEEQQTKIATQQAAAAAKAQGELPAELARLIEELAETKVNWKEALHRFVSQCAKSDYSWRRPNRRFTGVGVIMPTLYSETMPPVTVAIDTSGSVDADMLKQFAGELDGILQLYDTTVTVIYCDAKIQHVEEFTRETPVKLNAKGGGGTDFRPVFNHVDAQEDAPVCLIYLTDMEGTFPPAAPDYPVLWVTDSRHIGPFGETIRY